MKPNTEAIVQVSEGAGADIPAVVLGKLVEVEAPKGSGQLAITLQDPFGDESHTSHCDIG